jgi:ribosomal protein S18 acetylase RimI-like enzyme
MATLTHRPYASESDAGAVLELWLASGAGDPWPSADAVRAELNARAGGARDVELWGEGRHGGLAGAALLLDESVLVWRTRAGACDEALDAAIVAWGLERAGEAGRGSGSRPELFVPVRAEDGRLAATLERAGFREDGWRTLRMECLLPAATQPPAAPAGIAIRPVRDECDIAAATALHNALFVGDRKSAGERAALALSPCYRPGLDLVAVDSDGTVAGFAFGTCCVLERSRGRAVGWVEFIGVDRARRGRGLGRALTLHLLHALRAEGVERALLTTGAANAAARRLFEGCGFHTRHEIRWYVREAPLGARILGA